MKKDLKKRTAAFEGLTMKCLCLLFPVVFITGCVTTEEAGKMQYDINALRAEVADIRQKSKSIETQFPDQQKQFSELEDTQRATAKTMSDMLIRMQYLTTEVQMLTGRFEEARFHAEKNSAELKENREMLIAKMKQLELAVEDLKRDLAGPEPVPPAKEKEIKPGPEVTGKEAEKPAEKKEAAGDNKEDGGKEVKKEDKAGGPDDTKKDKAVEKGKAEKKAGADVKDLYMAAYEAYKAGRTVEAREKFQSFLMDHGENEYSDNARFWIAESFYKDGNYEDAILAYEELFKNDPDSDKVPEAMLKQGRAFYALKDSKTGRIILEKLIEKYPKSDEAKLAAETINKAKVPPRKK